MPTPSSTSPVSSDRSRAVSVDAMQAIDAAAIETAGIPRLLLMEHAGLAVARAANTLAPNLSSRILICCGMGFNGGDGFAAARHLSAWGYALRILVTGNRPRLRGEPAIYAAILQRLGLSLHECASVDHLAAIEPWLGECDVVIDALLGIGARGTVREPLATLIARINRGGKPVVAVDIPSGLDADTGEVHGVAINAAVTVTFGLPKVGCLVQEGPAHTGSLIVDSITIPRTLLERA